MSDPESLKWVSRTFTAMLFSALFCALSHAQAPVPSLSGRVMDHADIISIPTERALEDLLQAHEDSTGNQIAVLTIRTLDGESVESFALRAAREYELGTAENNNGILLIVAPQERKVRVEVGYGLEGAVPDAVAARIIRNEITPRFREDDYDGGVMAGTTAILQAVTGEYHANEGDGLPPLAARLVFGLVFGVVIVFGGFGAVLSGGAPGRILLTILSVFAFVIGFFIGGSALSGTLAIILYVAFFAYLFRRPGIARLRERLVAAAKKGERVPVDIGPFRVHLSGSHGSASGSGFGGGSGGGGFSGGGGSFGGGGASGGW